MGRDESDKFLNSVKDIEKNLRMIDYIIRKEGRLILKDYSITVPQFEALQYLMHNENMTIGELSRKMHLAFSTITDLIDRMEKAELVSRMKDPSDKRVVRLKVLSKGIDVLEKVLSRRIEFLSGKLDSLTDEEKDKLDRVLQRLHEVMEEDKK